MSNTVSVPYCTVLENNFCYTCLMAEVKTKKTRASVSAFTASVPESQRADTRKLIALFKKVTGEKPVLWGSSIVGFGEYHYKSERSSQEGDWPLTGFSPRKQNMTIYIMPGFSKYESLMKSLGTKYKTSVSCLYFKRLSDLHIPTLEKLVKCSVADMRKKYRRIK